MTDITTIQWQYLVDLYRKGELQKAELAEQVRRGGVPTQDAREMIAGVIEGSGQPLRQGPPGCGLSDAQREFEAKRVNEFAGYIADPDSFPYQHLDDAEAAELHRNLKQMHKLTQYKNRTRKSAREQAKRIVASANGVGKRTVEDWLKEFSV